MKKKSKLITLLLSLAMMLSMMPLAVYAEGATLASKVEKDLSKYELKELDMKDGEWRIFTDTKDNITLNVEVRCGDYVLPEDAYELVIEQEILDDEGNQDFTKVENGSLSLGEEGAATFIAYAVAKEGSGFKGQTEREHYIDMVYEYNIYGCSVILPNLSLCDDIITPMFDLYTARSAADVEAPEVRQNGTLLESGTDYDLKYLEAEIEEFYNQRGNVYIYWVIEKEGGKEYTSVPTEPGIYKLIVTGKGKYEGKYDQTGLQIGKGNPMKVTASTKTVKYSKVAKKAQTVSPLTVKNAKGKVRYSGEGTTSKAKKALKINTKTGKITVKKGTKKGTYKMKVSVSAVGTDSYLPAKVTKTVTIKVK